MSFFKEKEVSSSSEPRRLEVRYEYKHHLTELGQKIVTLMESYQVIDTESELNNILLAIQTREIVSQTVRDKLASYRALLRAKTSIIEAMYAILPTYRQGTYDEDTPLSKVERRILPTEEE